MLLGKNPIKNEKFQESLNGKISFCFAELNRSICFKSFQHLSVYPKAIASAS